MVEIREGELVSGKVLALREMGLIDVEDFAEVCGERFDSSRVGGAQAKHRLEDDLKEELGGDRAKLLGLGLSPGLGCCELCRGFGWEEV